MARDTTGWGDPAPETALWSLLWLYAMGWAQGVSAWPHLPGANGSWPPASRAGGQGWEIPGASHLRNFRGKKNYNK